MEEERTSERDGNREDRPVTSVSKLIYMTVITQLISSQISLYLFLDGSDVWDEIP